MGQGPSNFTPKSVLDCATSTPGQGDGAMYDYQCTSKESVRYGLTLIHLFILVFVFMFCMLLYLIYWRICERRLYTQLRALPKRLPIGRDVLSLRTHRLIIDGFARVSGGKYHPAPQAPQPTLPALGAHPADVRAFRAAAYAALQRLSVVLRELLGDDLGALRDGLAGVAPLLRRRYAVPAEPLAMAVEAAALSGLDYRGQLVDGGANSDDDEDGGGDPTNCVAYGAAGAGRGTGALPVARPRLVLTAAGAKAVDDAVTAIIASIDAALAAGVGVGPEGASPAQQLRHLASGLVDTDSSNSSGDDSDDEPAAGRRRRRRGGVDDMEEDDDDDELDVGDEEGGVTEYADEDGEEEEGDEDEDDGDDGGDDIVVDDDGEDDGGNRVSAAIASPSRAHFSDIDGLPASGGRRTRPQPPLPQQPQQQHGGDRRPADAALFPPVPSVLSDRAITGGSHASSTFMAGTGGTPVRGAGRPGGGAGGGSLTSQRLLVGRSRASAARLTRPSGVASGGGGPTARSLPSPPAAGSVTRGTPVQQQQQPPLVASLLSSASGGGSRAAANPRASVAMSRTAPPGGAGVVSMPAPAAGPAGGGGHSGGGGRPVSAALSRTLGPQPVR